MVRRAGVVRTWPFAAVMAVFVAAGAGLAQAPTGGAAKAAPAATPADPNRQRVPITTADGVELDGTYYRSLAAGRDSPCVLLVHKFGGDRGKSDWINLAKTLQESGYAVLTFDLRGHGGSTQISNPQLFWSLPFNRSGIRNSNVKKTTISSADFKPTYLPFLVNDLAAARRFLEQKNDAGEVNVHSLIIIGAQEGADLGLLFTAAEYGRVYRIGVTALQSNGTPYNAGEDIAAGVWLSMAMRPTSPSGAPNFDMVNWLRNHPGIRDRTPMSFVFGEKDTRSKQDVDSFYRVLTGPMSGRPDKHKLDEQFPIKGTDLAGPALLGQPALNVTGHVVDYIKKVMAERRAIAWTEVKPEVNTLQLIPVTQFGFRLPQ
jgi:pimeloyl-ACP methyl ester carboxylesterase